MRIHPATHVLATAVGMIIVGNNALLLSLSVGRMGVDDHVYPKYRTSLFCRIRDIYAGWQTRRLETQMIRLTNRQRERKINSSPLKLFACARRYPNKTQ